MPNTVQKHAKLLGRVDFYPIKFSDSLPVVLNPHSDSYQPKMPLHYHNAIEVSLCVSGSGVFFIEDDVHPYREGTLVQMGPNVTHIAHSEENQNPQWITLYLDIHYPGHRMSSESLSLEPLLGNQVLNPVESSRLIHAMHGISTEYSNRDAYSRMAVFGHLQLLLVELSRCHDGKYPAARKSNPGIARIAPALNHIAWNLEQSLPVRQLAALSALSESSFRRIFQSVMDQTPHQYILKTRIQLAKSLLHDPSVSVLEVSHRCGFESLSTFNRAFKKWAGLSPRQWRRNQLTS